MVKKELIENLKNVKVSKDRKWVYNLVIWALKNHTKTPTEFQNRISSGIYYAKGKYQEYWDNPRIKAMHKNAMKKNRFKNIKYQEKSKQYNTEQKIAYKLFKDGKLSKKSTKKIENLIKKQKNKRRGTKK